jgi:hypothetical protein
VLSVMQNRIPACRLHISHPGRVYTEHRHKVSLAFDNNHDQWEFDYPSRSPTPYLKGDQIVWGNPEGVHYGRAPVEHSRQPVGAPAAI